jgi:YidC/Oxa1 family membrane protein insertase
MTGLDTRATGFLWIPSLSGPIADRREGLSWLTEGWVDGVPKLGWEDTLCYLTLPVILVCTQTISLYLLGNGGH